MSTEASFSRRKFLAASGVAAGAAASGVPAQATETKPRLAENDYPHTDPSARKILVAYSSANGSTSEIADAIGKELAAKYSVEVRQMVNVTDLSSYQAVIMGSAIHGGQWLPEAMTFLDVNSQALAALPVATFLVCMTITNPTEKNLGYVRSFLDPVREKIKPVAEGYFAGVLWLKDFTFFQRMLFRVWFAVADLKEGDHRDWNAIRAWAQAAGPLLTQP